MGGRASTLAKRLGTAAPHNAPHPQPPIHPPSNAPLPPRAVASDFAKWQQAQQKKVEAEKWHTQRMLEEQRAGLAEQQAQKLKGTPVTQSLPTRINITKQPEDNPNQPIQPDLLHIGQQAAKIEMEQTLQKPQNNPKKY